MKTRLLICSLLLTVSNLFGQSTQQRVLPTTSQFTRQLLTNETALGVNLALGALSPTSGVPAVVVSNIVDGEIANKTAGYTPIVYTQPSAYYPASNPNGFGPGITPRGNVVGPNSFAPMVIWDDDFPVDVDDVMALGIGLSYMDDGLINIVAITSSTDRTNDPVSVPMTEAVANYYDYPGIMQGAPINTYPIGNPPLRPGISFSADNQMWLGAAQFYPHSIPASSNAPVALDVWRRVLANCPSNSIKIFMAGSLRNLYNLWNSGPDQWSALTGPQLIARSVSEIIQVNGVWPNNTNLDNVNFNLDPQAAWVSTNNFQVPVTYYGVPTAIPGSYLTDGATISNRSVGDITRVLHDTFQTNVNAIYPIPDGNVPDWCGPAIMWMAFGGTMNGVPIFSTVQGHANLASYGYSFSNWWTTAQTDQRYLVWQQNSNFYASYDEVLLGRTPRGHRPDILATKPNSNPSLVQGIPLSSSDPSMITVSNGFVTAASPWNPLALPNLTFWHDASKSTNSGGTKVTYMPDYGPAQTPGTNLSVYAPSLLANGLNGMPVFSFDAGNSNYVQSLAKDYGKPMTYFAVVNSTNVVSGGALIGSLPTIQGLQVDTFGGVFRTLRAGIADIGDSFGVNPNQWYILVATFDTNSVLQYYLNGVPSGRSTNNFDFGGFSGGMLIGATAPSSTIGNYFGGQIAEIGKCTVNLSSNQVSDLVAYLNRKWNVFTGTGNLGTQYFPTGANPPTLLVSQGGLLTSEIPWSPLGISQLAYWYDASQSTNIGGSLVTRAPDYGPLSLDATASGGNAPTLITNAQNGRSAYFFNGSTAYLQSSAKDFEKPMTFFGVFNATNATGPMGIVGSLPSVQGMEVQLSSGIINTLRAGSGPTVGSYSPINANTWYSIVITYDTNNVLTYYINGKFGASVTNNVSFGGITGGMLIGANAPNSTIGEFYTGYIGEIGKVTTALTPSQVSDLFTYLNTKWNVYFNASSSGSQYYGVGQTLPTMLQAQNGLVTANLNWNPLALRQLAFWFDGSQSTNAGGSKVTYLPDLGPFGSSATNISVYSPSLKANAINGLSALSFDAGNSNYLNSTAKDYEKPMTLFAVLQATNVTGGPWAIIGSEPTVQGMEWDINAGVQRVLRSGVADIGDSSVINATSNYVLVVTYDTNSCLTYYINGVVSGVTTNNLSFGGFTGGMLLGATAPNSTIGNFFGGLIGEIGKCAVALQTNEVADVTGYLNRKWGIYSVSSAAQYVVTNDGRAISLQGPFSISNPTNGTLFFVDLANNAYGLIQTNGNRLVWTNGIEYQVSATNTFWAQNIRATTSLGVSSNSMSLWPAAPAFPGGCAVVNSNGFPYILLSTNGSIGSATWTATNKFGW